MALFRCRSVRTGLGIEELDPSHASVASYAPSHVCRACIARLVLTWACVTEPVA